MVTPTPEADDREFALVFQNKYRQFVRVARRILPQSQQDEAEDVVSVAFQMALEKRDLFRGECKLSTWIYRICVNAAKEFTRRPRLLSAWMAEISENSKIYDPEDAYFASELINQTERLLPERLEVIRGWVNGDRDQRGTTSLKMKSWRSRRKARAALAPVCRFRG